MTIVFLYLNTYYFDDSRIKLWTKYDREISCNTNNFAERYFRVWYNSKNELFKNLIIYNSLQYLKHHASTLDGKANQRLDKIFHVVLNNDTEYINLVSKQLPYQRSYRERENARRHQEAVNILLSDPEFHGFEILKNLSNFLNY